MQKLARLSLPLLGLLACIGAGCNSSETPTPAATGGTTSSGGATSAGGTQLAGGTTSTGGITSIGGVNGSGGTSAGGVPYTGGQATGGLAATGGVTSTGGTPGTGGNATGGTGTPGSRTILPFDTGWLFFKGDAAGAEQAGFADTSWRALNVPHDWSIEGPFDQNAPTTGRGGYLPAGIGWYRKHFTLPQNLSGRKVYLEFDGVMANSTVYINGVQLGNHPYGYVSFRYDMTANAKFGTADNVISVKCDTSSQPASRFFAGSGIYRHVRVIATDPVHVDQWATYVSTKGATAAAATVHVQTAVVNSGTAAQSVSVQGIVSDPGGTALVPVTTPAQNIVGGATGNFTFDVPVTSPRLWDIATPSMYRLVTHVQVGGTTVDNDVTPFGIRSLTFDGTTGMNLNGKGLKFKGVCLHQDYHGLGLAAPQRAIQRRLAQLKAIGVNAIRTAHDPPDPEFLDLTDRMGFLVMDEFFDVWTGHKYTDVGDYATYFNRTATNPTGMPAVPGTATGAPWYQVDVTGIVMRDRNHPSIALYSTGNEIRDSLGTRTPILTKMVSICHTLDPDRAVTQALFRPSDSGDITGATRTLVDVFGGNYRSAEVIQAMGTAPARAGVLTEMGTETATWTDVTNNPALTGEFMWTGVDYLGESDGGWPTVGSGSGIMDEVGAVKSLGYTWSRLWGGPSTSAPPSGAVAGRVVLTADHSTLVTDVNDVSFIKAVVPTATAAVTFAITGPGNIVAVDSGSMTQESFRGNVRNAFGGVAYAIVQATGPGTITVVASSPGLTNGTATVQASAGTFVPCSGSCD